MFDIGWSEMAIIALVALLVLGPKELPQAMRQFAQFSKKMRRYANEFRAGVDNIVREAELEDAKKALDTVRAANPKTAIKKLVDPTGEMSDEVKSVEAAAKDGAGKTIAKPVAPAGVRPLPPGEPQGEAAPTGPDVTPTVPAAAPAAEPAVAGEPARRVSTPLQVAPPHSIRPPGTGPAETAKATPSDEGAPAAADLRKQA